MAACAEYVIHSTAEIFPAMNEQAFERLKEGIRINWIRGLDYGVGCNLLSG